jgi:hypothetical protein
VCQFVKKCVFLRNCVLFVGYGDLLFLWAHFGCYLSSAPASSVPKRFGKI